MLGDSFGNIQEPDSDLKNLKAKVINAELKSDQFIQSQIQAFYNPIISKFNISTHNQSE